MTFLLSATGSGVRRDGSAGPQTQRPEHPRHRGLEDGVHSPRVPDEDDRSYTAAVSTPGKGGGVWGEEGWDVGVKVWGE